jgi:hypothetical protein
VKQAKEVIGGREEGVKGGTGEKEFLFQRETSWLTN